MLAVSKKELAVGFDHSLLNQLVWFNPGHTRKQRRLEGDDLWCCALNWTPNAEIRPLNVSVLLTQMLIKREMLLWSGNDGMV